MPVRVDPGDAEVAALARVGAAFDRCRVLEIGCGEGRLTRRYADRATSVVAIDPDPAAATAFARRAHAWPDRLEFLPLGFEEYVAGSRRFDVIVFSWSL